MTWGSSCSMWTDGRTGMTKLIFVYRNFENALKIDVRPIKLGRHRNLFSAYKRYDLPSLYTCLPLVHIIVFVVVSCLCASNIDLNNVKKKTVPPSVVSLSVTYRQCCILIFNSCATAPTSTLQSMALLTNTILWRKKKIYLYTRWFKYDRDWFVCKQAALRRSCATLREWSYNLHPPSCSG